MPRAGRQPARGGYQADLAYVHHEGFRAVPEAASRWLVRYLATHRVPDGPIVDLGCGSGVFAAGLAGTGRAVFGFDLSKAMIALARRTAPRARFAVGSLHELSVPSCAVLCLVGEPLSYVPPDGRLPPLARTFTRLARALQPGGLLLLDLVTGPMSRLVPVAGHRRARDWTVLAETRPARGRDRFERHVTTFREHGGRIRRSDEIHVIQIHGRQEVSRALRRCGFRVRTQAAYDESSRLPGRSVFVARKRSHAGLG